MLGPLFWKELLEMARRPRYFVARTAVGLALLAGVGLSLQGRTLHANSLNIGEAAAIGFGLYSGWAFWVAIGVALLVPALVSGLVAGEKDGRTLEILLTTCLSPREILAGKVASRLFFIAVLLLSSVPALGFGSLYGGFSGLDVANAAVVHLSAAVLASAVGLYYSTISQKPYVALIRSYIAVGLMWFAIPSTFPAFSYLNPLNAMGAHSSDETMGVVVFRSLLDRLAFIAVWMAAGVGLRPMIAAFAFTNVSIALLLFARAGALLRKHANPDRPPIIYRLARAVWSGLVGGATTFVEGRRKIVGLKQIWLAELWTRKIEERRKLALGDDDPLGLRNATANVYDPEKFIAAFQIVVWGGVVAAVALAGWLGWNPFDKFLSAIFLPSAGLLSLLTALVLSASALARERQYGSWEVLLLVDLPAEQVLHATVAGVLKTLWPLWTLTGLIVVLYGVANENPVLVLGWATAFSAMLAQVVSTGLLVSIQQTRVAPAIAKSLGWVGAVALAVPIGIQLLGPWLSVVAVAAFWLLRFFRALALRRLASGNLLILMVPATCAAFLSVVTAAGEAFYAGDDYRYQPAKPRRAMVSYLELLAPQAAAWGGYGVYGSDSEHLLPYAVLLAISVAFGATTNFRLFLRHYREAVRSGSTGVGAEASAAEPPERHSFNPQFAP